MELALDTFDLPPDEVGLRFESARESGSPMWLWPDVTIERWQAALRSIERTIATVLRDGADTEPLDADPDTLSVACYTSGTGPLLGHWAERGLISPTTIVAPLLALHLAHNRLRIARMTSVTREIVSALAAKGVEVTVLKGMHTAHTYFPEPGARPQSDIDLLVRPSDEAAAGEVLSLMAFEPGKASRWPAERVWRLRGTPQAPRTLCLVHADDPWTIDLHTSLNRRTPVGGRVARLEQVRPEFNGARWTCDPRAVVLDQPLCVLHLAVHASCSFESLTLLRMVELISITRQDRASGSLSWGAFVELGRRTGTLALTYPALQCCARISPSTIPVDVLDQCRRAAPESVRRIVDRLEPALAQRVERCSIAERYMWADTWALRAQQLPRDLIPPGVASLSDFYSIYRTRFWRLMRRTVTR